MRVIAVDDEHLALKSMERTICKTLPACDVSVFCAPSKAIAFAEEHRVDVAFLDIEMGGMNGLTLAKRLKEIYGKTNIVFVTGYSEYAIDAFSVQASGYILKPVTEEAVLHAMEHLRNPADIVSERIRVRTFGNFEVYAGDTPLRFSRSKSKELFAYLVHRKGTSSTIRELSAVLFEDRKDGSRQIQTYISAMMKTLESAGARGVIMKRFNSLAVDVTKIDCDYYSFLEWDASAVNAYTGEYMSNYAWAEFTIGYLDKRMDMKPLK